MTDTQTGNLKKASHIGAPACFALELACKHLRDAFYSDKYHIGIYVVGSCLHKPDWRDVDVRMIMEDEAFANLFPKATLHSGAWEFDPLWCIMTVAISKWLKDQTGLPIDFQFQPMTRANQKYNGPRHPVGIRLTPRDQVEG